MIIWKKYKLLCTQITVLGFTNLTEFYIYFNVLKACFSNTEQQKILMVLTEKQTSKIIHYST